MYSDNGVIERDSFVRYDEMWLKHLTLLHISLSYCQSQKNPIVAKLYSRSVKIMLDCDGFVSHCDFYDLHIFSFTGKQRTYHKTAENCYRRQRI
ncbi:Hypothetical predicted protein [Octopus vulgaris]|uniref:Uncharacterized protein n=1 Tax=Octopus vulgaris TaxID=6645 RepID=A0AA36B4Y3_OCTVU|nr:Hypothetical predicted protein [Octopus vulgaris]